MAPSGRSPCSLKPTTRGISIDIGWPSIAASASMPPTPQPSMPRPLIIVVCESVPTSVSGYACTGPSWRRLVGREDHAREVLEVDLVDDARVGRDDLEALEGALAPAQERVALLVALELLLGVEAEGVAGAEHVDLHRVVDDQLGGHQRVDLGRVAAQVGHRVAHRGEVDDGGHAREVLHHDARGREGDLLGGLGVVVPLGQRLDVLGADADAVLVAEQVLEQDLQGEGQARDVELRLQRVQPEDLVRVAADLEIRARVKGIVSHTSTLPRYTQADPPRSRPLLACRPQRARRR